MGGRARQPGGKMGRGSIGEAEKKRAESWNLKVVGDRRLHCNFCAVKAKNAATGTVCNVLYSWSRGEKNEQQNNALSPKKQSSCRLSGSSENRAF